MTLPEILPLLGLEGITLASGGHTSRDQGVCLLEAVAWVAGEHHSDNPTCACPVVAAFGRRLNDGIRDDDLRTRMLRPLVSMLIGSKSTREVEIKRAYLAADWAVREAAPRWLDLHDSLKAHAFAMRGVQPIVDQTTARAARDVSYKARSDAYADAAYAAYADAAAAAAYAADAAYAAAAADAAYAAAADAAAAAAAADAAYAAAAADAARIRFLTDEEQINSAVNLMRRMLAIKE